MITLMQKIQRTASLICIDVPFSLRFNGSDSLLHSEWMLKIKKKKADKPLERTGIHLTLDISFLKFCTIVNAF